MVFPLTTGACFSRIPITLPHGKTSAITAILIIIANAILLHP